MDAGLLCHSCGVEIKALRAKIIMEVRLDQCITHYAELIILPPLSRSFSGNEVIILPPNPLYLRGGADNDTI